MSVEEWVLVGVLANSFLIQLPWFIIFLYDRYKTKMDEDDKYFC